MKCSQCGTTNPAGTRFCNQCGTSLTAGPPARAAPQSMGQSAPPASTDQPSSPGPAPAKGPSIGARIAKFGLWLLWIIIPTLVYIYLARDVVTILIVTVLGVVLGIAQTRPEIPAGVRPFLPPVQILVVYLFLGGSVLMVLLLAGVVAAVIWQRQTLVRVLEPWWSVQERVPLIARRIIGFVLAFAIGLFFGGRAGGSEWTVTLLSMAVATAVVFMLTYTPPDSQRRSGGALPAR